MTDGSQFNWYYLYVWYGDVAGFLLWFVAFLRVADPVLVAEVLGLLALGVIEIVTHKLSQQETARQEEKNLRRKEQARPRLEVDSIEPTGEPQNRYFVVGIKNTGKKVAEGSQVRLVLNGVDLNGIPLRRGLMWESAFTKFAWKVDIPPGDKEPVSLLRIEPSHLPPVFVIAPLPRVSGDSGVASGAYTSQHVQAHKGYYSGALFLSARNVETRMYPLGIGWDNSDSVKVSIRIDESRSRPALSAEVDLNTGSSRSGLTTETGPTGILSQAHPLVETDD